MNKLDALEPKRIWQIFEEICQFPRISKNEEAIRKYLLDFAAKHQLESDTDKIGNVVIYRKASEGYEKRKTVVLQSHMDMVGSKDSDHPHNWFKDPIEPVIDGSWVKAQGTTLGADDGIGMAAQLSIMENEEIKTGALECLFTVDEESGMTGAHKLNAKMLKGKILINLDSEDEGELFIGCAGGMDTLGSMELKTRRTPAKSKALKISITGLHGGHSGDEIHNGYANAIKLMNRVLWNATQTWSIGVHEFRGGSLRNAIPREAFAVVTVQKQYLKDFTQYINEMEAVFRQEYPVTETDLFLKWEELKKAPETVLKKKSQQHLIDLIYSLPHGVIGWCQEMPGLVETSTNLATLTYKNGKRVKITTSQRSSIESAKRDLADRIHSVLRLAGAETEHTGGYPGWKPNKKSEILRITEDSYRRLFDKDPVVRAIHAGLECGLFLTKYPDLDMISFGPTIKGAHTPRERIDIETTKKFWDLLLDVLEHIPEA